MKNKRIENALLCKTNLKKAGIAVLISENGNFRARSLMVQELIYQGDVMILTVSFPPVTALKYVKQKLTELKDTYTI